MYYSKKHDASTAASALRAISVNIKSHNPHRVGIFAPDDVRDGGPVIGFQFVYFEKGRGQVRQIVEHHVHR